jgi:hypothetical protein
LGTDDLFVLENVELGVCLRGASDSASSAPFASEAQDSAPARMAGGDRIPFVRRVSAADRRDNQELTVLEV